MSGKRTNTISWDEYFMGVAVLSSMRSKDPNTQVGACIVSEDRKIIGVGCLGGHNNLHTASYGALRMDY